MADPGLGPANRLPGWVWSRLRLWLWLRLALGRDFGLLGSRSAGLSRAPGAARRSEVGYNTLVSGLVPVHGVKIGV